MKIVYVANFEAGGNMDEEAICHALRELGHEVLPLRQKIGFQAGRLASQAQMLLFHKFDNVSVLKEYEGRCPRVFWWFDLVGHPDPTLARRCAARVDWMSRITPHVDFGFMSDGDWVNQDKSGKLHWLCQGADERIVGRGKSMCRSCGRGTPDFDILFTGIDRGGGVQREAFVQEMIERYGDRFRQVANGVYREELRDLIASAKILVCPDSPVTNSYWSNRVWNSMGFGAFVLHPYCDQLAKMYSDSLEITFYQSREELHKQIEYFLGVHEHRESISSLGLERTKREHLYRHRCEKLIQIVKENNGRV